ncbi:MAG TPA: alkyl hydroperoxide reductase subunit F [Steroidobacteraceae bacterium]|nr:alkyl hydroperoxide reductase subunit F [Steroidobacteraceae bacterium]
MLDAGLKAQLKGYLERLQRPVQIVASADQGAASRDMLELLEDAVSLSPLLTLEVRRDDGEITPSFALRRAGEEARVRFAGLPMGHEFTSLVLALLQAGGHPPRADAEVLDQVRRLEGELRFETFVSLSCQSCPDVVQALNLMAVTNPRVRHTMIDGALFQPEVERRQVMAVPAVFLNGEPFGQGRMTLAQILAKLDAEAPRREADRLHAKQPYDVLVVGAGPAGAAAAVYAARKGIRTGIAAERLGGQLLDTVGIENFISVKETEGHKLAAGLDQHVAAYEVDVMNLQRAAALIPGDLIGIELASGARLEARSVVIATGARWREINVPGEREYRNRGVAYCPHCDGPLYKGKRVAVIGGGNSGVEAAIDLAGLVSHVTLIEYEHELRADEILKRRLQSLPNVAIITGAQTTEVMGDGRRVTGLSYKERRGGAPRSLELAGVFVQIGLVPNTDWLKGVIKLSPRGEIEVNARGETSVPGVFAAGDCTVVPYKQIVIAMGEGAKASLSAFDYLIRSPLSAAA